MNTPQTGKAVKIAGKTIFYHETGKGEPLMLLHGGGPGASGLSNYSRNVEALSTRYRLIIPDLPGYGRSHKEPIPGPRFMAYAEAMVGLMDHLGLKTSHVVGNSLGGGAAIKMALEFPDRVARLILMGPAGLMTAHSLILTEGARMIFEYYAGEGGTREKMDKFIRLMIYDASNLTPELLEQRYQASIEPELLANPPLGKDKFPILEELWRDPRLAKLPHETLVLWGRDDRVNLLVTADVLVNQLPHARMVSFTHCGHWVQWERAQAFNTLVAAFLAGDL
jgi:2-hydroxy-6-oxonona-2,4-dienedioate hydrolase/4,5:9,10-diseco-3-hydroxy-5,9,17-trioxoandrosta-1(10),2-diene-4-oate hydrolase